MSYPPAGRRTEPIMIRKSVIATLVIALALAAGIGLLQTQSTDAQGRPEFSLPPQAVEIAPGIFSLGTQIVNGRVVEGIAIATHKTGHTKGKPGGGTDPMPEPPPISDPDPDGLDASCNSEMWAGTNWSSAEPWEFQGAFGITVADMAASLTAWSAAARVTITGTGSPPKAPLAVGSFNNRNETYFARIVGRNASGIIAMTLLWADVENGDILEWDMVFNTKFSWATDGSSNAMDFLNIATHEAGHVVGMGHTTATSNCVNETMYPTGSNGETKKQTLETGDTFGVQQLYGTLPAE